MIHFRSESPSSQLRGERIDSFILPSFQTAPEFSSANLDDIYFRSEIKEFGLKTLLISSWRETRSWKIINWSWCKDDVKQTFDETWNCSSIHSPKLLPIVTMIASHPRFAPTLATFSGFVPARMFSLPFAFVHDYPLTIIDTENGEEKKKKGRKLVQGTKPLSHSFLHVIGSCFSSSSSLHPCCSS